jgi:O-antigen/teichoic acid export membrane protein
MPIFAFMSQEGGISESSRRIARNSIALYVRMFVLMLVSLFTARIVLNALGTEDRGVYETVGSFVSMMSLLTSALSTAISRFLTAEMQGRMPMR